MIKEITKKYENVQKSIGDIMRGTLIETSARKIKNEAKKEAKKEVAISMLKIGKMTIEEIAECSELSVTEVEQLAEIQTVV